MMRVWAPEVSRSMADWASSASLIIVCQLRQDHPDFEGLAEANCVGDQQPGPQPARVQCLGHRLALEIERIEQHPLAHRETGLVQRDGSLAQHRLHPQPTAAEARRVVLHELSLGRVERLDVVEGAVEGGRHVPG